MPSLNTAKRDLTQTSDAEQHVELPAEPPPEKPNGASVRSWLSISFAGFEADDTGSSLFRKWRGEIKALRSDQTVISIPIISEQRDGPLRCGYDFSKAVERLETYRECMCDSKSVCESHNKPFEEE